MKWFKKGGVSKLRVDCPELYIPLEPIGSVNYSCPACSSQHICTIDDFECDSTIFRCMDCGEMYAARSEDVRNLPRWVIVAEWWGSYEQTKRISEAE